MEASEAEEMLEMLRGKQNKIGQIEYSGKEGQVIMFRITN